MKILKVIHGYPMLYNAGSEVYSQSICQALAKKGHTVHVFTREENSFLPDGNVRVDTDQDDPNITLHLVNNPRHRDRYRLTCIDQQFIELLDRLKPDVVHIGHLNHLSTSIVAEAKKRNYPILYTLHDYWLMCPRGQFMQMHSEDALWAACNGQENRKCAEKCYARYFSGAPDELNQDIAYWENWVSRRMNHVREMTDLVDLFVSPSRYLKKRYEDEFGLPAAKSKYLDYGFDLSRLNQRQRAAGELFTFGYIGTHIPAKGIHQLIEAFGQLKGSCQLRIWGRNRGQDSRALKEIADALPPQLKSRVIWMSEYRNQSIMQDVFNLTDVIVTPSIWVENSPLVIHEAQQARVPVITANIGGMSEYVRHGVNGLLYEHRNSGDLKEKMQMLVDSPALAKTLGDAGYLFSQDGNIPDIDSHVVELEQYYRQIMQ